MDDPVIIDLVPDDDTSDVDDPIVTLVPGTPSEPAVDPDDPDEDSDSPAGSTDASGEDTDVDASRPRRTSLWLAGLVVVAAAAGFALWPRGDDTPPPMPIDAMNADAARHLRDLDVAVPTELPPYFTQVYANTVRNATDWSADAEVTEYQSGGMSVWVCETTDANAASISPCGDGSRTVLRTDQVAGQTVQVAVRQGWVIPAAATDVPHGDHIAQVIWWWKTAPLQEAASTTWVDEKARGKGMAAPVEG